MNYYIVVEGKTEKYAYHAWIPQINSELTPVNLPEFVTENNYYIVSSMGYPQIFETIDKAIEDVNEIGLYNRLVIFSDSEDMTLEEKQQEIQDYINGKYCSIEIFIIIQHFCFETWALGNRVVFRRNPKTDKLKQFRRIYDVRINDPELLPPHPTNGLNRSQFAEVYLRTILNDRYRNLTYIKGDGIIIGHPKYFSQVKLRYEETGHIQSIAPLFRVFANT